MSSLFIRVLRNIKCANAIFEHTTNVAFHISISFSEFLIEVNESENEMRGENFKMKSFFHVKGWKLKEIKKFNIKKLKLFLNLSC
jgi:hypothetical protein